MCSLKKDTLVHGAHARTLKKREGGGEEGGVGSTPNWEMGLVNTSCLCISMRVVFDTIHVLNSKSVA